MAAPPANAAAAEGGKDVRLASSTAASTTVAAPFETFLSSMATARQTSTPGPPSPTQSMMVMTTTAMKTTTASVPSATTPVAVGPANGMHGSDVPPPTRSALVTSLFTTSLASSSSPSSSAVTDTKSQVATPTKNESEAKATQSPMRHADATAAGSGGCTNVVANGVTSGGAGASSSLLHDVHTSSGREALLLRFLQLLPSTHDLQQPLGAGSVTDTATVKACRQLLNEVVASLRLWVVQQPITLGLPLGDDNPSLFALIQPQLSRWRGASGHTTPSPCPSVAAPPSPPVPDDLLALAWGNRVWQPLGPVAPGVSSPTRDSHNDGRTTPSPPSVTQSPVTPTIKIEHATPPVSTLRAENGGTPTSPARSASSNNHIPSMPTTPTKPLADSGSDVGFEFNENDNLQSPIACSTKRRSSMGSLESGTVLMDHQPAKGRKRRKSFIERTSTTTGRQEDVENVSRELRKRKASGTLYDTGVPNAPLHTLSSAQGLDTSPKKIRFEDEDYIEQGVDKGKEVHSEMVDLPARGARGRGRGRGSRGSRGGRGRGGRGGHRERDLESTPKTRARKPESCHRCKNKKEFWVGCPLVASHKYCRGCVVRHFAIDYDDFRANPDKYWSDGCPICHLTCPCIGCVRKKRGQQDNGSEEDNVDVEKDYDDDDAGYPDEEEDGASGYDYEEDQSLEDDTQVDIDSVELSEEKSAESLIEVKWTALKRRLDVKDATATAADAINSLSLDHGTQHLPVKKRMSRMRSNSIATTHPNGRSSSSARSAHVDDTFSQTTFQTQPQPPRKRAPRLRSFSTSYCSDPKPSAVNPEDYLGCTGAGSVLAARYSSPHRRGGRARGAHN